MFTVSIKPKYVEIVDLMDVLIEKPGILAKNPRLMQRLGMHTKELRKRGLLHISLDPQLKETSIILKCSNYYTPGVVTKKKSRNHTVDYTFNTVGVPNIILPKIYDF